MAIKVIYEVRETEKENNWQLGVRRTWREPSGGVPNVLLCVCVCVSWKTASQSVELQLLVGPFHVLHLVG